MSGHGGVRTVNAALRCGLSAVLALALAFPTAALATDDAGAQTAGDAELPATLHDGDSIAGACTISAGGTYYLSASLAEDAETVTVTVDTTEEVRIVGLGYRPAGGEGAPAAAHAQFVANCAGVNLVFQNVYLSTEAGVALIDLKGTGNNLSFRGTNCLHAVSSGSGASAPMIHVGKDCAATFGGNGTLYVYGSLSGACIGGKAGETNGAITFGKAGASNYSGLVLFAMNRANNSAGSPKSSTGPIIGTNAETADEPGDITFNSGTYYLCRCNDGAAIGGPTGAASSAANVVMNGANVYVVQNAQCSNLAKSGWAHTVGAACEVTGDARGTLTYSAGSLLAYVTPLGGYAGRLGYNDAAYLPGIADAAINLRRQSASGQSLAPCYVDTAGLVGADADAFAIYVDDDPDPCFDGTLPAYTVEETAVYPSLTWVESAQTTLCLYLSTTSHLLNINGEEVAVTWNAATQAFDVALPQTPVHSYHIGYNLSGGVNSADNPTEYSSDTAGITLADPTREGYEFTGWTDLSGSATTGISAGSTGYKEFTATWKAKVFTLTYRTPAGTSGSLQLEYGTRISVDGAEQLVTGDLSLPDNPAAGYAHRAYTCADPAAASPAFTSSNVEPLSYGIAYVLNGGENDARNAASYTVESPDVPLYDPTKEGSSFDGWLLGEQTVTCIPAGSTGEKTLVAAWTENTLSVTYANEAGLQESVLLAPGRAVFVDGEEFGQAYDGMAVPAPQLSAGYAVAGYAAQRDAHGNLLLTTVNSQPLVYSLTYNLAGGTAGGAYPTSYTVETPAVALAAPVRAGFAFAGFVDAQGVMLSTKAADGTMLTSIGGGAVGSLQLTATWTSDYKTLRYLATDGTERTVLVPGGSGYTQAALTTLAGVTNCADLSAYAGAEAYVAPAPKSVKRGYALVAYVLIADEAAGVLRFAETPCLPVSYSITYNLEGGVQAAENPTSYTVESGTLPLAAPTRAGYEFAGWRDEAGNAVSAIASGSTGNLTFTATWTACSCTLTYAAPNGTDAEVQLPFGATYTVDGGAAETVAGDVRLPNPTRTPDAGYLFVGYTVELDAQGNAAFTSTSGKPVSCLVTVVDPLDKTRLKEDGSFYRMGAVKVLADGVEVPSGTAVPNGTVLELAVYPLDGYVFDAFTVNGAALEAGTYRFTVTDHTVVSAALHDINTRACVVSITDETAGKVQYSITKTGVVYKNGNPVWVTDLPVNDGDAVYEEDVLTLQASLADGAAPDDPSYTYLDADGALSPCRFQANGRLPYIESPGKYQVSATELAQMTDGTLHITVMCPVETPKNWLQLADSSWYDASDPQTAYTLSTPEQLAGMVRLINQGVTQFEQTTITLARDISLANNDGTTGRRLWQPSNFDGSTEYANATFKGCFDGAGHCISGLDISVKDTLGRSYNALFSAAYGATFKNLTIEGSVDTVTANAAALVAFASDCSIENVTNRATVRGCTEFAGIAAVVTGLENPTIRACRNEGAIEYGYNAQNSNGTCGGIAANINEHAQIVDCVNTGAVSSNVNDGFVGGIVGHAGGSATKVAKMGVTNCRNYGSVTVRTNQGAATASHIGGIVGFGPCAITQCANFADVANTSTSTTQTVEVGGIIGAPTGSTVVKYCANSGNVSVVAGAVARIGGIAGWYDGGGTVMYCANTGTVDAGTALEGKGIPVEYAKASGAGGLVGVASANGTDLYYSYNAGVVLGASPAEAPLSGSAIGLAYGVVRLINVLVLEGTAAQPCGSYAGAGVLTGDDVCTVTSAQLATAAAQLNAGVDGDAFLDDLLAANGEHPLLSWMATRTVSFVNDDAAVLATVAVPESFTATAAALAERYAASFGTPVAAQLPAGCTLATFARWSNVTAGQDAAAVSVAEGNAVLRAVYSYDNNTFALVYHTEDGSVYRGANPATYCANEGVAAFEPLQSEAGLFVGWRDAAGSLVESIAPGETGARDLYAVWDSYVSADALQGEIAYARYLLATNAVSADGADVVSTRSWASAAAHEQLQAGISAAEAVAAVPNLTQSASSEALRALQAAEDAFCRQLAAGSWALAITQQPVDCTAALKDTVSFAVETNDRDAVKSYEWQYSTDGEIWSNARNYVKSDGEGYATARLSFTLYELYDGHQWRCKVTFKDGTAVYSAVAKSLLGATDPVPSPTPSPTPGSDTKTTKVSATEVTPVVSAASTAAQATSTQKTATRSTAQASAAATESAAAAAVDDDEALWGYGSAGALVRQTLSKINLVTWIVLICACGFALGLLRSARAAHKYDKRLKEWM